MSCEIREKTVPLTERMISQIGGVGCTMKPNQIPEGISLGESAKGEAKMNYWSPTHSGGGPQVGMESS